MRTVAPTPPAKSSGSASCAALANKLLSVALAAPSCTVSRCCLGASRLPSPSPWLCGLCVLTPLSPADSGTQRASRRCEARRTHSAWSPGEAIRGPEPLFEEMRTPHSTAWRAPEPGQRQTCAGINAVSQRFLATKSGQNKPLHSAQSTGSAPKSAAAQHSGKEALSTPPAACSAAVGTRAASASAGGAGQASPQPSVVNRLHSVVNCG